MDALERYADHAEECRRALASGMWSPSRRDQAAARYVRALAADLPPGPPPQALAAWTEALNRARRTWRVRLANPRHRRLLELARDAAQAGTRGAPEVQQRTLDGVANGVLLACGAMLDPEETLW